MSTEEKKKSTKSLQTTRKVGKMVKSFYSNALERKANGVKVAWCGVRVPVEILYAMDIQPLFPEHYAAYCAAKKVSVPLCQRAEEQGYSQDLCSYARVTLGHVFGKDLDAPVMAEPDMFLTTTTVCDTRLKWFEDMAEIYNKPLKIIELPYGRDIFDKNGNGSVGEEDIELYAREMEYELIPFLENETGKRMDWGRFQECLELSRQAQELLIEVYSLRKNKPCPMGAGDAFSTIFPFMYMIGTREAVDFYQELLTEVKQKVNLGLGIVENERFRLLWSNIPFWFNLGLFHYFKDYGGVVAMENTYYLTKSLDPSDPFRSLAAKSIINATNGSVISYINFTKFLCREYDIDGVLLGYNRSCRPLYALQLLLQKDLQEDMGIPSVLLESDMADERTYSEAQINSRLDSLAELILAQKG